MPALHKEQSLSVLLVKDANVKNEDPSANSAAMIAPLHPYLTYTRLYSLHWTSRKLAHSLDFSISHFSPENNVEANRLPTPPSEKEFESLYRLVCSPLCGAGKPCRDTFRRSSFSSRRRTIS